MPTGPGFPVTVIIDSNDAQPIGQPSHPTKPGAIVFLVDYGDGPGHPFGIWGRVVELKGEFCVCETIGDQWSRVPFTEEEINEITSRPAHPRNH